MISSYKQPTILACDTLSWLDIYAYQISSKYLKVHKLSKVHSREITQKATILAQDTPSWPGKHAYQILIKYLKGLLSTQALSTDRWMHLRKDTRLITIPPNLVGRAIKIMSKPMCQSKKKTVSYCWWLGYFKYRGCYCNKTSQYSRLYNIFSYHTDVKLNL